MSKRMRRLNGILLLAVILLAALVSGEVYGKYVKQESFIGSFTVTAELGSITVQESRAARQPDGSYTLDTGDKVKNNTYVLIPGLDIPKDPAVSVDKESAVPVYVFLEVEQTAGEDVVTFAVDASNWKKLDGIDGQHGGDVYVYASGGTAVPVTESVDSINILAEQTVTVSQKLGQVTGDVAINFYAEMRQVVAGQTPASIYSSTDY